VHLREVDRKFHGLHVKLNIYEKNKNFKKSEKNENEKEDWSLNICLNICRSALRRGADH
jgi:hypothetical protein